MDCLWAEPVRDDPSKHRLGHVIDVQLHVLWYCITNNQPVSAHFRDQGLILRPDLEKVHKTFNHPFLACFICRKRHSGFQAAFEHCRLSDCEELTRRLAIAGAGWRTNAILASRPAPSYIHFEVSSFLVVA